MKEYLPLIPIAGLFMKNEEMKPAFVLPFMLWHGMTLFVILGFIRLLIY